MTHGCTHPHPFLGGVWGGGEGDADTLTPLACLLWADVGVVCPTAIADLIKSEETHHFIWLSPSFGLALIQ